MKWFAYAAGLVAIGVTITITGYLISAEAGEKAIYAILTLFALPIAAGIAILRYRLYDIDLIINRTIVYGSLTAILAGVYSASVLLFRLLFESVSGSGSQTTTVLTTLVLAALFTPIKNRLQALVDRYVGRAPEPRKDLAKFADELRLVIRALQPEATLRALATLSLPFANASGVRIYLRSAGLAQPVLSEGIFDGPNTTRVSITAKGTEVGWLDLVGPSPATGLSEEDRRSLEQAASVVADALALGLNSRPASSARFVQA
jgi:hypothetical protein